jgi:hypothetical protein
MALVRAAGLSDLVSPVLVAAFDGWVDAGSGATRAAGLLAEDGDIAATFDHDALYDYRARRPTLEIVDGRPTGLEWPELSLRRRRVLGRDALVLSGPEPDYRWRALADAMVELALSLGVTEWLSLGAIPAAVPHTRPVTLMGTESRPGLLRGGVMPGPAGVLRVPSALVSVLDLAATRVGIPAAGYYAQVPHYVSGPYPAGAVELLLAVGRHLGEEPRLGTLPREAQQLRERLDLATASDDDTRAYVQRLETMVDESRLPSGDELIADIERFLRDTGSGRDQIRD